MTNEQYIPTKKARQILGVTTFTLRNWDKTNKINTVRSASGVRLYSVKDIQNILNSSSSFKKKKKIAYCRVSSKKQADDLERQKNFLIMSWLQTLALGLIGKEKDLKPFWNQQCLEISQNLWLPTEIDYVDSALNLSSGSLKGIMSNSLCWI